MNDRFVTDQGAITGDGAPQPPLEADMVRLFAARSVSEAWLLHTRRMAAHGFDRILYSLARMPGDVGVLEDTLILSNHPRVFLDRFLRSGWWRKAVFLAHAERTGAVVMPWRLNPALSLTPEQKRMLAFRERHGIVAGYTISFRHIDRDGRAGTGLCARPGLDQDAVDAIWAEHGMALLAWNTAFHLRVSTLPLELPGRTLTDRQREVLRWVSDGKTVQDIAVLMRLRPATVEKHLRLARAALGVQTTAQAVLKAALLNQTFRVPGTPLPEPTDPPAPPPVPASDA